MAFIAARKETHILVTCLRTVFLADEPILLMHHTVMGQYLYRFHPGGVYGFILGRGYGKKLRQIDTKDYRDIRIFTYYTSVFDSQQRKFALYRGCFHYIPHCAFFFLRNRRYGILRFIR